MRKWGKEQATGRIRYEAGSYFMALDISEKYQSQIHWPLEQLEISVAFRQSKHGELYSVTCIYCVCLCVHMYILLCEYLVCYCVFWCVCI